MGVSLEITGPGLIAIETLFRNFLKYKSPSVTDMLARKNNYSDLH
jgi:hypothetical protein